MSPSFVFISFLGPQELYSKACLAVGIYIYIFFFYKLGMHSFHIHEGLGGGKAEEVLYVARCVSSPTALLAADYALAQTHPRPSFPPLTCHPKVSCELRGLK